MKKRNDLQTIAKHWAIEPQILQNIDANMRELQSGLSLFSQKPLEHSFTTTIRDGVAIIPVKGIITARFDLFTLLMGGTSLDVLARDIQTALDDKSIHSILLDIDSPGGVAVGPSEMAAIIRHACERKKVWAYVGRNCCSAAYWLASATKRIVAQRTALLGSRPASASKKAPCSSFGKMTNRARWERSRLTRRCNPAGPNGSAWLAARRLRAARR